MARRRHQLFMANYINRSRNENKNKINIIVQYAATDWAIYDNDNETWQYLVSKVSKHASRLGKETFDTDKRIFKQMPLGDEKDDAIFYVENCSEASKRFYFQNKAMEKEAAIRDSVLIRIVTLKVTLNIAGLTDKRKHDICSCRQLTFQIMDCAFYWGAAGKPTKWIEDRILSLIDSIFQNK